MRKRAIGAVFSIAAFLFASIESSANGGPVTSFVLDNGMQVVVLEDHRAPVVTHMVWYRVGAADDPPGKSGLAHFLEHLMFKQTAALASGEFTRIVTRLGGRHNALTTHDTTSYFQRVAKQHLRRVMELEAERMINLRLVEAEVLTERDVVGEERRSSIDASPIATINEQILAQLYQNHTYGRPVLGWSHEMSKLTLEDAASFYRRHYAPNNAVLIVAGDVTPDEVRALALQTYGRAGPQPQISERMRPLEPPSIAVRKLRLEDARTGPDPLLLRYYHVPSFATAEPGDGEALQVLARVLGGDDTSRLYRGLVLERRLAVQAGADYQSAGRDSGRLNVLVIAAGKADESRLEQALDEIVGVVREQGITEDELVRAKRAFEADAAFDTDNQEKRARRYGEAITLGRSLAEFEASAARLAAVTAADVQRVAREHLDLRRSVTGVLARPETKTRNADADATAAKKKSAKK